jgi:hypothetical protein
VAVRVAVVTCHPAVLVVPAVVVAVVISLTGYDLALEDASAGQERACHHDQVQRGKEWGPHLATIQACLRSLAKPRPRPSLKLDFTRGRKPTDNGHISFNGRMCDECLNVNQFTSLSCEFRSERSGRAGAFRPVRRAGLPLAGARAMREELHACAAPEGSVALRGAFVTAGSVAGMGRLFRYPNVKSKAATPG